MKKTTLILLIFISISLFSQKQTANWYFGEYAGLDFNSGSPIVLTDGQMRTNEGCATLSDYNGNLLLYTNGVAVWNRKHEFMVNGENLNGNFSSTNSAIIIPIPENSNLIYIFTVDDLAGTNGLQYSEVDMSLDGGLGAVTSKKNRLLHTPTTEKITAVKHQNETDWWVLSHRWNSSEFTAYLVNNNGISSQVSSIIGTLISGRTSNTVGAMKLSPDGRKLAIANSYDNNHVQLFDFNNLTGKVSNPITLTGFSNTDTGVYGIEFSIDSNLLYVTDSGGSIYQYNTDLPTATGIINSRITIANSINNLGALQIAPNGKIYVALEGSGYLGVIDSPNTLGVGSNYIDNSVFLNGRKSGLGLPPFIQSYFWKEILVDYTCFEDFTQFTIANPEVSHVWNFGDPASGIDNTSNLVNPTHLFTSPGNYVVEVQVTNFLGETSTTIVNVTISEIPIAAVTTDYITCDNDFDEDYSNGIVQNFLLSEKDFELLGNLDINLFDVQYFEDENLNLIINKSKEYENIIPYSQTIYAKVFNNNDGSCYNIVKFNLIVKPIPYFELEAEKIICSNILPDEVSILNPSGNYNYEWRFEDGSIYATTSKLIFNTIDEIPKEGLNLTAVAIDQINTCTFSKPIKIERFELESLTQEDIQIEDLSENNTIRIVPLNPNFDVNDYQYALGDDYGNIGIYQNQPFFENVKPGSHILYTRDKKGCGQSSIKVFLIGFQKFFTPNNDGYNDTWRILGLDINNYSASTIIIFDRFGKIVSRVNPFGDGWDGYYNSIELPSTDYWFSVELIDLDGNKRAHKGHFSLIRK